jgi:hypothetical protein
MKKILIGLVLVCTLLSQGISYASKSKPNKFYDFESQTAQDITFSGITAYTMDASFIGCVEKSMGHVKNITLRDITLHCKRNERSRAAEHFTQPHWEISSPDALDFLNIDGLFISNLRVDGGDVAGAKLQNLVSDRAIVPIEEKYLDFMQ